MDERIRFENQREKYGLFTAMVDYLVERCVKQLEVLGYEIDNVFCVRFVDLPILDFEKLEDKIGTDEALKRLYIADGKVDLLIGGIL